MTLIPAPCASMSCVGKRAVIPLMIVDAAARGVIVIRSRRLNQRTKPLKVRGVSSTMDHPMTVRTQDREIRCYVERDRNPFLK